MRLAYVVLTAISLFLTFLIMTHLDAGMRELLSISWVVIGIYCMTRFARAESPRPTSGTRQRDYRELLERRTSSPRRSRRDDEI